MHTGTTLIMEAALTLSCFLQNYMVSSQKIPAFMATYLAYILLQDWLASHFSTKCSLGFSLLLTDLIFIF